MSGKEDTPGDELSYAYKPSLLGPAAEFHLARDALEWRIGARNGRIPYRRITRVRLSFRPGTIQANRFFTEIWAQDAPKLEFASTSWKSMVEHERHDSDYSQFVTALHRRIAAAGAETTTFVTGFAAALYWAGAAVFAVTAVGLAGLTVRAVQLQAWSGAVIIGIFFLLFLWQVGNYFRRNRPGTYRPDALPALLLPQ